ncbi:hypothetical protein GCM10010174_36370 [Kutzneria viridogrisea]
MLGGEQPFEHGGGEVEGQVAHDHVLVAREPVPQHVPGEHGDVLRYTPTEASRAPRVEFDRGQGTPRAAQRQGEGTVSGADLHDRSGGGGDQRLDRADHRPVDEEVLAEFVRSTREGGRHGCAPQGIVGAGQREQAAPAQDRDAAELVREEVSPPLRAAEPHVVRSEHAGTHGWAR